MKQNFCFRSLRRINKNFSGVGVFVADVAKYHKIKNVIVLTVKVGMMNVV
jgi:hypothetical protein